MSELSDLLGGLLGNEAGKDSGGMDGLFDLLGGLMQSAPAQKESPQQETSGAKGPDAADFEQILHIVRRRLRRQFPKRKICPWKKYRCSR